MVEQTQVMLLDKPSSMLSPAEKMVMGTGHGAG